MNIPEQTAAASINPAHKAALKLEAIEYLWDREINKGKQFLADSAVVPEMREALYGDDGLTSLAPIKAQAIREAADAFDMFDSDYDRALVAAWLDERADEIERGDTR